MQFRITTVATKDGRGTFALVDVVDGLSYRSVGTTKTYWTASRNVRAVSHAHTLARRYYKAHAVPFVTAPARVTYAQGA